MILKLRRRQKLGVGLLALLAAVAFSAPFLFKSPVVGPRGPGGGGGNGGGSGTGSGQNAGSTAPSNTVAGNPSIQWNGWHGLCGQGMGKHLGILKRAAELDFNLTRIIC